MTSTTALPDIAAAFQHILQDVALDEQPLFIALAERMAADAIISACQCERSDHRWRVDGACGKKRRIHCPY